MPATGAVLCDPSGLSVGSGIAGAVALAGTVVFAAAASAGAVVFWALAGPARASPAARRSVVNPSMRIVDIHPVQKRRRRAGDKPMAAAYTPKQPFLNRFL